MNICKHCGAEIERNGDRWVDTASGDAGGTYDYCPLSRAGTEDERLHVVADREVVDAILDALSRTPDELGGVDDE